MIRSSLWSVPAVLALMASVGLADEGSVTTGDLDARVEKAIFQTINVGVPIFNGRDAAGCYRIYQGSLIALGPFLAHRPDLQASVQNALASVGGRWATYEQRAVALRAVLDDVRAKVMPKVARTSLWARLGGEPAVKAVVHDFVLKAATDPKVDFTRGGKYPLDAAGVAHLEELLVQQISSVSGGPLKYTGRDMKSLHAGMGITDGPVRRHRRRPDRRPQVVQGPPEGDRRAGRHHRHHQGGHRRGRRLHAASPGPPGRVDARRPSTRPRSGPGWAASRRSRRWSTTSSLKAATDPKVDFTRGGKYPLDAAGVAHLEELLVQQVSSVSGGPLKYTGQDMKPLHAGMGITDAQFGAIAGDLIEVLKSYKVPQKEIDELVGHHRHHQEGHRREARSDGRPGRAGRTGESAGSFGLGRGCRSLAGRALMEASDGIGLNGSPCAWSRRSLRRGSTCRGRRSGRRRTGRGCRRGRPGSDSGRPGRPPGPGPRRPASGSAADWSKLPTRQIPIPYSLTSGVLPFRQWTPFFWFSHRSATSIWPSGLSVPLPITKW